MNIRKIQYMKLYKKYRYTSEFNTVSFKLIGILLLSYSPRRFQGNPKSF